MKAKRKKRAAQKPPLKKADKAKGVSRYYNVRVPQELRDDFLRVAAEEGRTISSVLREALSLYKLELDRRHTKDGDT